jgi:hypothetical protein
MTYLKEISAYQKQNEGNEAVWLDSLNPECGGSQLIQNVGYLPMDMVSYLRRQESSSTPL